jgi:hypothetical protein
MLQLGPLAQLQLSVCLNGLMSAVNLMPLYLWNRAYQVTA